jgi:hypothetical protein
MKTAARMVAKDPGLVVRIKPDGEIEIASKPVGAGTPAASPDSGMQDQELDAGKNDDVWAAIAAIKSNEHGRH